MPHPFRIRTPLGDDALALQRLRVTDGLSVPFRIEADCLAERADLDLNDVLGKPVTFTLALRGEGERHFHGFVSRMSQGGGTHRRHGYQLVVRPWLWFLSRTTDCRIFQHKTVPEIVKDVFEDHGIANADFQLFRSYRTWDYCVQYRESDLDFVSRLLEHEGIYYRFQHTETEHKLVLVDDMSAHDPLPNNADTLPLYPHPGAVPPDTDHVSRWSAARSVLAGKFALQDYDFERPSTSLLVQKALKRNHDLSEEEAFDYPGLYTKTADGTHYLDNRMDEVHAAHDLFQGTTNAQDMAVGGRFTLARHPREDQNAQYLVTAMVLDATNGSLDAIGGGMPDEPAGCRVDFDAMPVAQAYRPPRRTRKAVVQGPQTAVVVGSAGNEIETDKYGRVKVQFHWDRYGRKDEKSSCWVRVAQVWAGKNFGAIFTPRIGQEVIVDFLEGDPDQPIITGRVYNAEQMPPWDLPANATQSGILTRSSKGGGYGNANAIRFEDKKGAEQLWIHAEKNQDIEVESDETHSVGHDRTKTIGHDETTQVGRNRTESVGLHESITIGANRAERVGANETITIGANRMETVGANETITIGANRTESVGASETVTIGLNKTESVALLYALSVGAAMNQAIGAALAQEVGAAKTVNVGAYSSEDVGLDKGVKAGKDINHEAGKNINDKAGDNISAQAGGMMSLKSGKDYSVDSGKKVGIVAAEELVLKCGSAEITMKKNGDITIKGNNLSLKGSGKITADAGGDMTLKGSKIAQN